MRGFTRNLGIPVFSPKIFQGVTEGILMYRLRYIIRPEPCRAQRSFFLALAASIDDLRSNAPSFNVFLISSPGAQGSGSAQVR
jgi:hypothetical protein